MERIKGHNIRHPSANNHNGFIHTLHPIQSLKVQNVVSIQSIELAEPIQNRSGGGVQFGILSWDVMYHGSDGFVSEVGGSTIEMGWMYRAGWKIAPKNSGWTILYLLAPRVPQNMRYIARKDEYTAHILHNMEYMHLQYRISIQSLYNLHW